MADGPGSKGIRSKTVRSDLREMLGQFNREVVRGSKPKQTTARLIFMSHGFDPAKKIIELHDMAIQAFNQGRGMGEAYDPGPQYLAIAAKMIETSSRLMYPGISPVKIKFDDAEENDSSPTDAKKYSATQVRDVILSDPFAAEKADAKEAQAQQEQEMNALMSASIAAIAKGEIDGLESILPTGKVELPVQEITPKVRKKAKKNE